MKLILATFLFFGSTINAFGYMFTSTVLATEKYRNQNKHIKNESNHQPIKSYKSKSINLKNSNTQNDPDDELDNMMNGKKNDLDELGKIMFNKLDPKCLDFRDNELVVICK